MSLSDADYLEWLRTDHLRVVLAEVECWSGGAVVTRYLSDKIYASGPYDTPASTPYLDLIAGTPSIRQKLGEPLGVGALELDNPDGELDTWLDDSFDGRPIRLYIGDPAWSRNDFRMLFTGIVDHLDAGSHNTLVLAIRDKKELLNKPIQENTYSSGPAQGQPKPLGLGFMYNVEPILTNDSSAPVYQVHDGAILGVTEVRVNGMPLSSSSYSVDLANGVVTIGSSSYITGRLTMDVQGAAVALFEGVNWYCRLDMAIDWLARRAGLGDGDIDAGSLAALRAKLTSSYYGVVDNLGYYLPSRQNAVAVLDELTASMGCGWYFGRDGKLKIWRLDVPTGTAALTLTPDDIEPEGLRPVAWEAPVKVWKVGGRLNWTVQDRASLSPQLSAKNRDLYAQDFLTVIDEKYAATYGQTYIYLGGLSPDVVRTYLYNYGNAAIEADRLRSLRLVPRRRYSVNVIAPTLPIELGTEIRIIYPRFGFANGANGIVVGIEENVTAERVVLEVWK